jgi:hypothetical protein
MRIVSARQPNFATIINPLNFLYMTTNVLVTVYETLLCSPGMNEAVKIDVKMNRKTVLLLNSLIEGGLGKERSGKG